MKKSVLIVLFAYLLADAAHSQIGGLSASKLRSLSASTVEAGKIEFEPSFMIGFSSGMWNDAGILQDRFEVRGHQRISEMNFRFSYGLARRAEIGVSISGDLSTASLGAKLQLIEKGRFEASLLSGFNLNGLQDRHIRHDTIMRLSNTYAAGFVGTYSFNERLSLDADLTAERYISRVFEQSTNIFANSNLGYYITDFFQVIAGVNYSGNFSDERSEELMGEIGFTVEKGKQFIIMVDLPFSIYGRSCESYYGIGLALTILLD